LTHYALIDGSRDVSERGCSKSHIDNAPEHLAHLGRGLENIADNKEMEHPLEDKLTTCGLILSSSVPTNELSIGTSIFEAGQDDQASDFQCRFGTESKEAGSGKYICASGGSSKNSDSLNQPYA
jgi:hypothetical protein